MSYVEMKVFTDIQKEQFSNTDVIQVGSMMI